jgi:hypothetical protein
MSVDADSDVLAQLFELLAEAQLKPRITGERSAMPAQFDMLYGVSVAACAMHELARDDGDLVGARTINASLLKFGQFLAARPQLVPDYLAWREHLAAPHRLELHAWPLLPRGFLTDAVPDGVVAYLVAAGELTRAGKNLRFTPGKNGKIVGLYHSIVADDLFKAERKALEILRSNSPTLTSLGIQ